MSTIYLVEIVITGTYHRLANSNHFDILRFVMSRSMILATGQVPGPWPQNPNISIFITLNCGFYWSSSCINLSPNDLSLEILPGLPRYE